MVTQADNVQGVGAHYLTAPTGSVVLHISAGDRLLTKGQPTCLLFSLSNRLPLFFCFSPSVFFHLLAHLN